MTDAQVLGYAGEASCPICFAPDYRRRKPKVLYGQNVCRKCFYRFANLRQVAYVLDSLLLSAISTAIIFVATTAFLAATSDPAALGTGWDAYTITVLIVVVALQAVFCAKDGFGGHSPGKLICGVKVVSAGDHKPIGFAASLTRHPVRQVRLRSDRQRLGQVSGVRPERET